MAGRVEGDSALAIKTNVHEEVYHPLWFYAIAGIDRDGNDIDSFVARAEPAAASLGIGWISWYHAAAIDPALEETAQARMVRAPCAPLQYQIAGDKDALSDR